MGQSFREKHSILAMWLRAGIADKPVAVKCACGWLWELPSAWEWRSESARADKLLDAYIFHRDEGTPPVIEPTIRFQREGPAEHDDYDGSGYAD